MPVVFLYKSCTPNGDTKDEDSDIGEPVLVLTGPWNRSREWGRSGGGRGGDWGEGGGGVGGGGLVPTT